MTERALQRKVMNWLKNRGQFINKSPSMWDRRGIPDIIGCHAFMGAVAIELKEPGRYADPWDGCDPAQKLWLKRWASAGGVAIIADSLETVAHQLEHIGSNIPFEEGDDPEHTPAPSVVISEGEYNRLRIAAGENPL